MGKAGYKPSLTAIRTDKRKLKRKNIEGIIEWLKGGRKIEILPNAEFDMSVVVFEESEGPGACGSFCCIAGAAISMFGKLPREDMPNLYSRSVERKGAELLGVSREAANYLFLINESDHYRTAEVEFRNLPHEKMLAIRGEMGLIEYGIEIADTRHGIWVLENLLETGYVDWVEAFRVYPASLE